MANGTRTKSRVKKRARVTPAELLYGKEWVERQWKAAQGLLKGRGPKNPVAWQRKIRREWERSR